MEEIYQIPVGFYQTNCYVIRDEGHVLIIDPGKKAERIASVIQEDDVVDAILLTHGHFDHIGAVDELANMFHCPVYLHFDDDELVHQCGYNRMNGYEGSIHHKITYLMEGHITIGTFDLEVISAPGHTPGSVLIIFRQHCFCGDVLFKDSIGRTDLYGGNESDMMQTLKMIKTLDRDLLVYPGHGETSTLERELAYNPFLL
ncbi:MAG: MBL fold metallo-hydrolase [Erysipelotrichaceae bacterium]|nr:MBL fold metallo-hydrolase [Erysipelotrichaceae bacterium]